MSWTEWRILADKDRWYDEDLDYSGAACYELGTAGPRGGNPRPHYVGETGNAKKRMPQYASHGSHLSKTINRHLNDGWCLYYQAWALPTKEAAMAMQNPLLARYKYDWTNLLNRD
jgi:hypothetical protein